MHTLASFFLESLKLIIGEHYTGTSDLKLNFLVTK